MTEAIRKFTHGPLLDTPAHWGDIVGKAFAHLYVIGFTGERTRAQEKKVTCRCDCGLYVSVLKKHLLNGNTTSCGCARIAQLKIRNAANAKHGDTRGTRADGTKMTALYRAWMQLKARCQSVTNAAYADYGGRGIKVHLAWSTSYAQFKDDLEREIGPKPSRAHSLDRIDNNGHYEPGNLRWATQTEQNRNQRTTKFYELGGKSQTLGAWAEAASASYARTAQRVQRYGWELDEALGTPPGIDGGPVKARRKWTITKAYRDWRANQ